MKPGAKGVPYDQRLAALRVRPLAHTPVTPNHVTTASLLLGLAAAALFAWGDGAAPHWAAGLVIAARFIDHMDGELARMSGRTSQFHRAEQDGGLPEHQQGPEIPRPQGIEPK